MITVSTAQNKGVPVSRANLQLLCSAGLVHYSLHRMRFEGISSAVTPYVIETFVKQVRDVPNSHMISETDV